MCSGGGQGGNGFYQAGPAQGGFQKTESPAWGSLPTHQMGGPVSGPGFQADVRSGMYGDMGRGYGRQPPQMGGLFGIGGSPGGPPGLNAGFGQPAMNDPAYVWQGNRYGSRGQWDEYNTAAGNYDNQKSQWLASQGLDPSFADSSMPGFDVQTYNQRYGDMANAIGIRPEMNDFGLRSRLNTPMPTMGSYSPNQMAYTEGNAGMRGRLPFGMGGYQGAQGGNGNLIQAMMGRPGAPGMSFQQMQAADPRIQRGNIYHQAAMMPPENRGGF